MLTQKVFASYWHNTKSALPILIPITIRRQV
jgi:hypothetical protein